MVFAKGSKVEITVAAIVAFSAGLLSGRISVSLGPQREVFTIDEPIAVV